MRLVIVFLFVYSFMVSQNQSQREFIKNKSSYILVSNLKTEFEFSSAKNNKDVQDFLINNPTIDNKDNLQRIIDGIPYFYQEDNNVLSVETLRANSLYPGGSLGLNITGTDMYAGVWDSGKVKETHVEFGGRVTLGDSAPSYSSHGTHVAGTIIAAGVSAIRRGFAYQGNVVSYDWTNDIAEIFNFASSGFLVSNHSYGNIATSLPVNSFGAYNSQSIEVDQLMNAFPYYQMVKSAGNDRNNTAINQVVLDGGFDLLTGVANAKNVITVAAVKGIMTDGLDESYSIADFSNFGPTDDGRIKPDISAKGVGVSSPISTSNTAYDTYQGTSMASPAITGLILLLQKHYNNLTPDLFMKSATVRGLLCQSAREAGDYIGPDYSFGWGVADGLNAARIITNKGVSTILEENNLVNNQVFTKNISLNSTQDLNVVLSWTDPTGTANSSSQNDNRTPRLVNNLDLKVLKDGSVYYPWKLNPDSPLDGATNISDNNVDNIERVEIFGAAPGVYTIQVTHKASLQGLSQDFSLIASGTDGISLNNRDFEIDNSVFIYPNPATTILNYNLKNNIEIVELIITDLTGKQIYNVKGSSINSSINISNFEAGVYFIKFISDTNKSIVKKFIKK